MTFAALQTRINTTISAKLGDAATLNGVAVSGGFMDETAVAFGLYGDKPIFELDGITIADHRGKTLIVAGVTYLVRESKPNAPSQTTLLTLEEQ